EVRVRPYEPARRPYRPQDRPADAHAAGAAQHGADRRGAQEEVLERRVFEVVASVHVPRLRRAGLEEARRLSRHGDVAPEAHGPRGSIAAEPPLEMSDDRLADVGRRGLLEPAPTGDAVDFQDVDLAAGGGEQVNAGALRAHGARGTETQFLPGGRECRRLGP